MGAGQSTTALPPSVETPGSKTESLVTGCSLPGEPLYCALDSIAKYIISDKFKALRRLTRAEYCDRATIYIAEAIKRKYPPRDLAYKDAVIKGDLDLAKARISIDTQSLGRSASQDSSEIYHPGLSEGELTTACIAIARFYQMVNAVYTAISLYLNPVIESTYDSKGYRLEEWAARNSGLSSQVDDATAVKYTGFCPARLEALDPKGVIRQKPPADETLSIQPELARIKDMGRRGRGGPNQAFSPDFSAALDDLFADTLDKREQLVGKSAESMQQLRSAITKLYEVFTEDQKAALPKEWQSFANVPESLSLDSFSQVPVTGRMAATQGMGLMKEYGDRVLELSEANEKVQMELLGYLSTLFKMVDDLTRGGQATLVVNPSLSAKDVEDLMVKTRNTIIGGIGDCQDKFIDALKIYEQMVWEQAATAEPGEDRVEVTPDWDREPAEAPGDATVATTSDADTDQDEETLSTQTSGTTPPSASAGPDVSN